MSINGHSMPFHSRASDKTGGAMAKPVYLEMWPPVIANSPGCICSQAYSFAARAMAVKFANRACPVPGHRR